MVGMDRGRLMVLAMVGVGMGRLDSAVGVQKVGVNRGWAMVLQLVRVNKLWAVERPMRMVRVDMGWAMGLEMLMEDRGSEMETYLNLRRTYQ